MDAALTALGGNVRREMWTAHFGVDSAVSERVRGSGEGGGEGERRVRRSGRGEVWETDEWGGVQELKWPCGPDADKLPSPSAPSSAALIRHCRPAAFHPFLPLLLSPKSLSLHILCVVFPPPVCILLMLYFTAICQYCLFATAQLPSSCKDFFTSLCLSLFRTHLTISQPKRLFPPTETGMEAIHWISGIPLLCGTATVVARRGTIVVARSTNMFPYLSYSLEIGEWLHLTWGRKPALTISYRAGRLGYPWLDCTAGCKCQ